MTLETVTAERAPRTRSTTSQRLLALLAACACSFVLHERVHLSFERLRIGAAGQQQASGGIVAVPLPDVSQLAGEPLAIVLRLSTIGPVSRTVHVAVGDAAFPPFTLPPGRHVRVDLSLPAGSRLSVGDRVEIASDSDDWTLESLEIANVHGFSRGLFAFVIVPAAAVPATGVGILASVGLLLLLWRFPRSPSDALQSRAGRVASRFAALLSWSVFGAVVLAPLVSDYGILLAWHTFVLMLAALYLSTLGVFLRSWSRTALAAPINLVRLLYVASFVLFLTAVARFYDPATGFTSFIHFGEQFEALVVPTIRDIPRHVDRNSPGYDGQFYAQLAVDPLLTNTETADALDSVAYRARRILASWTAFSLGLGRPRLVLQAYATQNILIWIILALLLLRWLPATDLRSFCLWFACLFSHGMVFAVTWALPDALGLLLLALSVVALEQRRDGYASALVGIGGLAKDTGLLWCAVLCDRAELARSGWRTLLTRGILVAGPLALWMGYLWCAGHISNEALGVRNFAPPFVAYLAKWDLTLTELRGGGSPFAWFSLFALTSSTVQLIVLLAVRDGNRPWWRVGIASCALMACLGPAQWEGHVMAATRILLPMTVAFNVLLPRNRWFWPLFVIGNLPMVHGLEALGLFDWIVVTNQLAPGGLALGP